jgi:hypothetical protein
VAQAAGSSPRLVIMARPALQRTVTLDQELLAGANG